VRTDGSDFVDLQLRLASAALTTRTDAIVPELARITEQL
jgi:hypothetical protein